VWKDSEETLHVLHHPCGYTPQTYFPIQPSHRLPISVSLSDETTNLPASVSPVFLNIINTVSIWRPVAGGSPRPKYHTPGNESNYLTSFSGLPWARGLPDLLRVHGECLPRPRPRGDFEGVPHLVVVGFAYTGSCWCGRSAARLYGPE